MNRNQRYKIEEDMRLGQSHAHSHIIKKKMLIVLHLMTFLYMIMFFWIKSLKKLLKKFKKLNKNTNWNIELNFVVFWLFPNTIIAYRILLNVRVTVASAERSFSKLNLIKSYLPSPMSQKKGLVGLLFSIIVVVFVFSFEISPASFEFGLLSEI